MRRFSWRLLVHGGLLVTIGLLIAALTGLPAVALAQADDPTSAMVEGSRTDIDSWSFAARVAVGGMVTWTNLGSQVHTVTAIDGAFDSGAITPGAAVALQFAVPGLFTYACAVHPSMKGYV